MKVIYIAGPFRAKTAWQIECNIRHAENTAFFLMKEFSVMPLIPHANTRYFHGSFEDQFMLYFRIIKKM